MNDELTPVRAPRVAPRREKGVRLRGREFNGIYYVRAEDVVTLLDSNAACPIAAARLKAVTNR
ncbi:MAG TPA: hypothetical protein VJL80_09950 [Aeromicrobium sp.]|nr:hypothetical protein [Aeromicrobium sp.]HKY58349.1 hypothetical protein [Aeromicrobium sp.]